MYDRKGAHTVLLGLLEGKNYLKELDVEGKIIFKWA